MIDHVLGRPSVKSRRLQVLIVLSFWTAYLAKGNNHGPPLVRVLSKFWSKRLTAWQTVVLTMIYLYAARNFSTLVNLASPEPMANMYDKAYFRATWVLTALDAGFWTAMKIKSKWLRDLASIVFSVFYMFAAERADEKVRKVRGMLTVEHLRISWNKGTTPYLRFFQGLLRPRLTRWPPRAVRIPRPAGSDYKEPVTAWLYYDGPLADLERHNKIVMDIPGGGFVAMDPRCNDDKLTVWAVKTGLPVLSLDYKKAPEFPYPYAINECFDVYTTIIKSNGRCIGMSGRETPRVILTGDSAGGNLATATTLMIIERTSPPLNRYVPNNDLPLPDGLVLFYPGLDMNIGNWMSDDQMSLMKDRSMRGTNRRIVRRKSMQYNDLVGTPHHSDDEDEPTPPKLSAASEPMSIGPRDVPAASPPDDSPHPEYAHGPGSPSCAAGLANSRAAAKGNGSSTTPNTRKKSTSHHAEPLRTRLAMSSMISYFNDRVLTPEMMRAMIILYIGPHNRPDFSQDYLLSPVLAPDALLARFPKVYFLTGERDPLVDDTVIFAARIRKVKEALWRQQRDTEQDEAVDPRTPKPPATFNDKTVAEVALLPGISHGFLQFPAIYPPAWGLIDRCTDWFGEIFATADAARHKEDRQKRDTLRRKAGADYATGDVAESPTYHRHHRRTLTESSADDDGLLEMAMTSRSAKAMGKGPDNGKNSSNGDKATVLNNSRKQSSTTGEQSSVTKAHDAGTDVEGTQHNGHTAKGRNGRTRGPRTEKSLSLVRLKSSEDLLGRRMQGLAGGLTGQAEDEDD